VGWLKNFMKTLFSWSVSNEFYYVQEELKYEEMRAQLDSQTRRIKNIAS
jgi:hypothetical protein